ncbi:hypothetical protein AAFF_G00258370 [Aldrovandia affinis]|uniref:Uncharacterized protein n=1 Tax=Aldrovandia affinis TaxID=143900 RepID=A0AAD7SUH4_9TELE|nr:hypothetical protein AAFF_G00258370 [Aldrovandia affinis]
MVFWLLSMLATRDREEMSRTLLAMSSSQDSCLAMRKSGCVPLLVQILHDGAGGQGEAPGGGVQPRGAVPRQCCPAQHRVLPAGRGAGAEGDEGASRAGADPLTLRQRLGLDREPPGNSFPWRNQNHR